MHHINALWVDYSSYFDLEQNKDITLLKDISCGHSFLMTFKIRNLNIENIIRQYYSFSWSVYWSINIWLQVFLYAYIQAITQTELLRIEFTISLQVFKELHTSVVSFLCELIYVHVRTCPLNSLDLIYFSNVICASGSIQLSGLCTPRS